MSKKTEIPAPPSAEEEAAAKAAEEETKKEKKDMGKSKYVYICSKMACDNAYTTYHPRKESANDMPRKNRQILIKGGSGVVDKQLVTPHGVVTKITREELDFIKKNDPAFARHEKRSFLKVFDKEPSPKNVKEIAKDMPEDKSKQATEESVKGAKN